MFTTLKTDLKRYKISENGMVNFFDHLFRQEIWALFVYRFGSWIHFKVKIPLIRQILKIIAFVFYKFNEIITGVSIPYGVAIGPGLYIGHFGRIIIHHEVKIGKNFSVGPGVVIGTKGVGHKGAPVIGDDVYVGVGAKILGNITIGNHARVGANSVVIRDVEDGNTVAGVPAVVVKARK